MTPSAFRTLRTSHGSQRAIAKELGIGFRTIQRLEDGTYGDPIPAKYANMIVGLGALKSLASQTVGQFRAATKGN